MGGGRELWPSFAREPSEAERMIDDELGLALTKQGEIEKTLDKQAREEQVQSLISRQDKNNLNIACLDVGQGDATVIRLPTGEVMVVDCNRADANVDIVDFLKSCGVRCIDYLVITHPHYDHMSGLESLASNFEIRNLMEPGVERTDIAEDARDKYDHYCRILDELDRRGTPITRPLAGSDVFREIGDVKLYAYGPSRATLARGEGRDEELHTNCIVMKIEYGNFKMLFSGDADQEAWGRISKYYDIQSTVLHASHHGSTSGCDEECISKISPSRTIISAGRGNPFGHPDSQAVRVYRDHSKNGIRTTKNGSLGISASRDGTYIFYD